MPEEPVVNSSHTETGDLAWNEALLKDPHRRADKAKRVEAMFAAIAPSYDLNNRVHSLWRDQAWRKATVRLAELREGDRVLDVACGTGDLARLFAARGAAEVVGLDFTQAMLDIAIAKPGQANAAPIEYRRGDAMDLPFDDGSFDVLSIAFGIRNVTDPAKAIAEFQRVLRPGGRVLILEFTLPRHRLLRGLYNFYFRRILPRTATLISRDRTGAYRYLPESVNTFIGEAEMRRLLEDAGFQTVTQKRLTCGIAAIYRGLRA
ncbi:MAG: bifunctional demethylmenaquinone methyltransferase/2-methoxy-6-polyprenyl-1,4-benzoquinol methylase UbiE [Phycisphaerales bacterium JB038]